MTETNLNFEGEVLIIPKELTQIDKYFGDKVRNSTIKYIMFEEGSQLEKISQFCFSSCENLLEVDFSNCQKLLALERFAFHDCKSLERIIFPKNCSLKTIGDFCISSTKISEIDLSCSALETISQFAFARNLNLKTINLKDCRNLKTLEKDALSEVNLELLDMSGCHNIKHIESSRCETKIAKISSEIIGDASGKNEDFNYRTFHGIFPYNSKVQLIGRNGILVEFFSRENMLGYLDMAKTGIWKFAKDINKNASNEVLPYIITIIFEKRDYKNLLNPTTQKYCNEMCEKLEFNQDSILFALVVNAYYKHGGLGIKNEHLLKNGRIDKGLEISYRNLLAKNYLKFHPDETLEKIEDKEKRLIAYQRKINNIARNMPINVLVGEFLVNNILSHTEGFWLLRALFTATPRRATDLNLASFLVQNIEEILKTKQLYSKEQMDNIKLSDICDNFDDILRNSHKKVVTRSDRNRLTIEDCNFTNVYNNVLPGNELLAQYCGEEHISSEGFDFLQKVFERAKEVKDLQVLGVCEDDETKEVYYKYIEKDNPFGLVLGNKTNCCQSFGQFGEECMVAGMTDPYCGFVTINNEETLIGQAWVWYDVKTHTVALDNIEVPEVCEDFIKENEKEIIDCLMRVAKNFKTTMEANGNHVQNVIIGAHATDIPYLEKYFKLEFDMGKTIRCPIISKDRPCYSDVERAGQFIVIKNGKTRKLANKKKISAELKNNQPLAEAEQETTL